MDIDDADDVPDLVSAIELLDEDEVGAALGMAVTAEPVPEITFPWPANGNDCRDCA